MNVLQEPAAAAEEMGKDGEEPYPFVYLAQGSFGVVRSAGFYQLCLVAPVASADHYNLMPCLSACMQR